MGAKKLIFSKHLYTLWFKLKAHIIGKFQFFLVSVEHFNSALRKYYYENGKLYGLELNLILVMFSCVCSVEL